MGWRNKCSQCHPERKTNRHPEVASSFAQQMSAQSPHPESSYRHPERSEGSRHDTTGSFASLRMTVCFTLRMTRETIGMMREMLTTGHVMFLTLLSISAYAAEYKVLSGLNIEGFEKRYSSQIVWDKNPFVQPLEELSMAELAVSGIIYHPDDKGALISDHIAREGEKIGMTEILNIEKKNVVFRNEAGIFRLTVRGSSDEKKQE